MEDLAGGVTVLKDSLQPLRDHFNDEAYRLRFVALLSPTWPRWAKEGTRAVRQAVLESYPDADVSITIVWISMMEGDDAEAVERISDFFDDKRVRQFFDPTQMVGKAIAASLGSAGEVSWDTYLFYMPGLQWGGLPPGPTEYMHQLHDHQWADQAKMRTGQDLIDGLFEAMGALTERSTARVEVRH